VNLQADVKQLGTSAVLDNIVGLYEIADPDGSIDIGQDLDGDGKITTTAEKTAKDGIGDILPTAAKRSDYASAALQNYLNTGNLLTFSVRAGSNGDPNKNYTTTQFNGQGGIYILGGKLYAPFIIANGGSLISGSGGTVAGAVGSFLNVNSTNAAANKVTDPVAYFGFSTVNPDGVEHLKLLRTETSSIGTGNQVLIYGFEDLPGGGDRDYNDAVFGFDFQPQSI
jgi:hypothetical protein